MKFINKYIVIATVGVIGLSACSDELDVSSPSQEDANFVYSNSENALLALNGVYNLFGQDSYTSRMSNVWMQNTDVEASAPSAGVPSSDRRAVWSLQSSAIVGFNDIYAAWNHNLQAIDRANQVIAGIDRSPVGQEAEMQQIKGEAIFLKAYRYYLMCNFWGDVPYYEETAAWGQELDKPRTDKFVIYSRLLQQMVNTGKGPSKPSVDLTNVLNVSISSRSEADSRLKLEVYKNGSWIEMTSPKGEPACKLAVGQDFTVLGERQSIKRAYPNFLSWVENENFSSQWW